MQCKMVLGQRLIVLGSLLAMGLSCAPPNDRRVITVAAASDLTFALDEIVRDFQRDYPYTVRVSYGASGNLFQQIVHKAPFDVYLSADEIYTARLETAGLVVPGSVFRYGTGAVVFWMPERTTQRVKSRGLDAILDPSIRRIAIANPDNAPYGRAAMEAVKKLGLFDRIRTRLVAAETAAQAAQMVQSGSADAAFISATLSQAPGFKGRGSALEIPASAYRRPAHTGAVTQWASNREGARAFCDYAAGPKARLTWERLGLSL